MAGPRPGFQGSETSSVEVTVYPQQGDPVVLTNYAERSLQGRNQYEKSPSIVAVNTDKTMGAAAGSWSVTCKPGRNDEIFDRIRDDDWVDITFRRHGKRFLVMRGLVDDVMRTRATGGTGATTKSYTISGRDFGKIWEVTPIWFSPWAAENVSGAVSQRVFVGAEGVLGDPVIAVTGYLSGMLEALADVGRAHWQLPPGLPQSVSKFIDEVSFDLDAFPTKYRENGSEALVGLSQNWLMPSGNLWQLGKEWSDPLFNELFTDIRRSGTSFDQMRPGEELLPDDAQMTVVFRERPFPNLDEGRNSPWFKLPTFEIARQDIVSDTIGRGGAERYNAFFVAPQLTQELLDSGGIDLAEPLWNPAEISRHGLRRFDVSSKYSSANANLLTISRNQRERIKDWYCLNPYLLTGSIQLGLGRPDIRIGSRLLIPSTGKEPRETYYVEQVTHDWVFGRGTRTSLGVTRGFRGTDDELLNQLTEVAASYITPPRPTAAEASIGGDVGVG